MKKLLSVVLCLCLVASVFATLPVTVVALTEGDFEYKINKDDGTAIITHYTGNAEELTIPSELGGYKVTEIGQFTFGYFSYNLDLKSVIIPEGVTTIGNYCFTSCTNLENITIPDSVNRIVMWAFEGTAWFNNQPDGVVYAGKCVYTYKGTMPDNTTINLRDDTVSISSAAFRDCTGLTAITIPDSVTSIDNSAFHGCTSLTEVVISNNITSFGISVFGDCTSLKSISLPDNFPTNDMDSYFYGCTSLTTIIVSENSLNYSSIDGVLFNKDKTTLIRYPAGLSATSYTVPDSVEKFGYAAFNDCTNLKTITLPNTITVVDGFRGCTSLESITIPDSVKYIGSDAFWDCTSLQSIVIPEGAIGIGEYAFNNCTSLQSITIPRSVTDIFDNALVDDIPVTIYCYEGSAAEMFALSENIPYVLLEETTPLTDETSGITIIDEAGILPENTRVDVRLIVKDRDYSWEHEGLFDSIEDRWGTLAYSAYQIALKINYDTVRLDEPVTVMVPVLDGVDVENLGLYSRYNNWGTEIPFTLDEENENIIFKTRDFSNTFVLIDLSTVGSEWDYYGDVNGDKKITVADVTAIQKHLAKIEELDETEQILANAVYDGSVDIADATEIQKYLAKLTKNTLVGERAYLY